MDRRFGDSLQCVKCFKDNDYKLLFLKNMIELPQSELVEYCDYVYNKTVDDILQLNEQIKKLQEEKNKIRLSMLDYAIKENLHLVLNQTQLLKVNTLFNSIRNL